MVSIEQMYGGKYDQILNYCFTDFLSFEKKTMKQIACKNNETNR